MEKQPQFQTLVNRARLYYCGHHSTFPPLTAFFHSYLFLFSLYSCLYLLYIPLHSFSPSYLSRLPMSCILPSFIFLSSPYLISLHLPNTFFFFERTNVNHFHMSHILFGGFGRKEPNPTCSLFLLYSANPLVN